MTKDRILTWLLVLGVLWLLFGPSHPKATGSIGVQDFRDVCIFESGNGSIWGVLKTQVGGSCPKPQ